MTSPDKFLRLQQTLYSSANPTRRWLHRRRYRWVRRKIGCLRRRYKKSLEVGPGSGVYLPLLASRSDEVVAADIEPQFLTSAARRAQRYPSLHCVSDDITASKLPAGSFDLILCTEVIEHIEDGPAVLAGLKRLLSSDGTLVLTTPQRYSLLELCAAVALLPGVIHLVRRLYAEPVMPTGHVNLMTRSQLKRMLSQQGFTIAEENQLGFYLPLVAEFAGAKGQRWLAACERYIRGSRCSWLLWTQCYVVHHSDSVAVY